MPRGDFDRSARKAETRARLLEAAAGVYARSGFAGATLDQVAAEAGLTKGALYSHFGSKENLLLALMEEHLAVEIAQQIELFDRERTSWERPLAGSDHWMHELGAHADPFRLFVELWSYAQREPQLRERLAVGLGALQATFARFAATSASDAGIEPDEAGNENLAATMLGLGIGLQMLRLVDERAVPVSLLGIVLSILVRALESDPEAGALLASAGAGEAVAR